MNIHDVSKKAGVSIATISRVLNQSPRVSSATRDRVLDVIREMGYTPNAFARGLGLKTMQTIGVLCADSSDLYMASAINYIERELQNKGYNCLLCCSGYEWERKTSCMALLLSRQTDAIVLIGSQFVEDEDEKNNYIREAALKVPVFLINGHLKGEGIYAVLNDDCQAVKKLTCRLLDEGVNNIHYLCRARTYSGREKLKGYEEALISRDIIFDKNKVHDLDGTPEDVRDYLVRTFPGKMNLPDAFIASDDLLAVGVVKYARQKKLAIPEEIMITGYNNSVAAICCEPELSSMDNKVETVCIHVVSTLLSHFEGEKIPEKTFIQSDFIDRETTKKERGKL